MQGEVKGEDGHGALGGVGEKVPQRRWEDWERSRVRKIQRDERRRREFERQFGSRQTYQSSSTLWDDSVAPSETASSYGGDEDRWGLEIGQYREDAPSTLPPPVGLFNVDAGSSEGEQDTLEAHELELVLDQGWADDDSPNGTRTYGSPYASPRIGSPLGASPKLYSLSDAPSMGQTWSNQSLEPLTANSASPTLEGFSQHRDPFSNAASASYQHSPPSPYRQFSGQASASGVEATSTSPSNQQHFKRRSLSGTHAPLPPSPTGDYGRRLA